MVLGFDVTSWYGLAFVVAGAYVFWATVLDTGHRHYRAIRRRLRPEQLSPQLGAHVRSTGHVSYVLEIKNTGDVSVEQVAVDMPSEAWDWTLLTDGLATYPIPVLEPGDSQAAPVAVAMGPHASIEITLRGLVSGQPYERRRTVSAIGAL